MPGLDFTHSPATLQGLATDVLANAAQHGADEAEVSLSDSFGQEIGIRAGQPETVDCGQYLSAAVTAHVGQRCGTARGNSLAVADLATLAERAVAIARQMTDDDCNGLPDADRLLREPGPDLDLHHPWRLSVGEAMHLAREAEEASWAVAGSISREKSEGAAVNWFETRAVLANSRGLLAARDKSTASVSCAALVELDDGTMDSGWWGDSKLAAGDLEDGAAIGRQAGERAAARAGARKVKSGRFPVLFECGAAHSLIGGLLGGISGGAVHRNLTYLAGALGERVCAEHLGIAEDPLCRRGYRSSAIDSEGVRTAAKDIISAGRLATFLLDAYSARKLGMPTTGNAGGARNVTVCYRELALAELLREMGRGLFVTGTMGAGGNFVTGDYSCGAYGFWVEDGAIVHPVRDATIAGRLPDLYAGIVAGGSDRRILGGMDCGSLLVEDLAVGGND